MKNIYLPIFEKRLYPILGLLIGLIAGSVLGLLSPPLILYTLVLIIDFGCSVIQYDDEAIRNIGLIILAIAGAPFVIWRAIAYQKQVNVAEQGHFTDRINEAVKGLGTEKTVKKAIETPQYKLASDFRKGVLTGQLKIETEKYLDGTPKVNREMVEETVPNLEVRIGAIYSLERIAQDSLRDHIQIMEILCAYVRENSRVDDLKPVKDPSEMTTPNVDIQTAITVIGRRSDARIKKEWGEKYRLDLSSTNLSHIDFKKGNFSAALFIGCRLEFSSFDYCDLTGTKFNYSLLNYATFEKATISGTNFNYVIVNRPIKKPPNINANIYGDGSILNGNIKSVIITNADLSAIYQTNEDLEKRSFGNLKTKLHSRQEPLSKENYPWWALEDNPIFANDEFQKFKSKFSLLEWPYTDD